MPNVRPSFMFKRERSKIYVNEGLRALILESVLAQRKWEIGVAQIYLIALPYTVSQGIVWCRAPLPFWGKDVGRNAGNEPAKFSIPNAAVSGGHFLHMRLKVYRGRVVSIAPGEVLYHSPTMRGVAAKPPTPWPYGRPIFRQEAAARSSLMDIFHRAAAGRFHLGHRPQI